MNLKIERPEETLLPPRFPRAIGAEVVSRAPARAELSALDLTLKALRPLLAQREVTELCINRPGIAFLETREGWRQEPVPFADFEWCRRLAKLVANSTRQRIDEETPLLSASLPTGERIQMVLPPATSAGCVAITIRRPCDEVWSIETLSASGIFRATRRASETLDETEAELLRLLEAQEYESFMRLAVLARKNILVSGPTGSGKTTWTKALIRESPRDERLITIEDAQELVLDHPNHVRLFYSKDDQGLSRVTPKQLLESCLRMKPDRILLAELRAEYPARPLCLSVGMDAVLGLPKWHQWRELLSLAADDAVLLIERTTWSRGERASFARLHHAGSRFELRGVFDL